MFMAQSRANMAPMNVPPGSPRQSGGGGGKGGGSSNVSTPAFISTPGGGGKGGGRPTVGMGPSNQNMGSDFSGPNAFGGPLQTTETPAWVQNALQSAGPVQTQAISPSQQPNDPGMFNLSTMFGSGGSAQPSSTSAYAPQPVSAQAMLSAALGAGQQPSLPSGGPNTAIQQSGPAGLQGQSFSGLMGSNRASPLNAIQRPAPTPQQQAPAMNQYGLPMGTHPSQMPANPGPRPMAPTPAPLPSSMPSNAPPSGTPVLNEYGLPAAFQPPMNPFLQAGQGGIPNMQGLMAQLQGFGGF